MNKETDLKCKTCKKSIGKLDVDGKPIFKTLQENLIEYNGHFCSEWCYTIDWLNCWGNESKYNKNQDFLKGYRQAMRDVYKRFKKFANVSKEVIE